MPPLEEELAAAIRNARTVGYGADACIFVCCGLLCRQLLVLAWTISERTGDPIESAKSKARRAGWYIWPQGEGSGRVLCPVHALAFAPEGH